MNAHKVTVVVVLSVVAWAISAPATGSTEVGGFISTDQHWTLAGGPYVVVDSIAIIAGATLTIDPGVEVRVNPGLALVVDTGALVARGTEASPIRFTANQGSANRWAYLQFSDNAVNATFDPGGTYVSGSILDHTVVQYAGSTSIQGAVRAINSTPFIHTSTVQNNARGGMWVEGSGANSIRVEGNTISGNTNRGGICVSGASAVQISGNTITDNTTQGFGGGVWLSSSGWATLTDNIIADNTTPYNGGGLCLSDSNLSTLTGNTILNNTASTNGGGVFFSGSDSVTLAGNAITNNTAGRGGALYARYSDNVTLTGDRITDNHSKDPNGVGGICLFDGSDAWDLTGPDETDPLAAVHIYGNDNYQFYNDNALSGFGYGDPGNVDARYVYWGTTNEAGIEAGIYDFFDDASKGVVFYSPFAIPEPATLSFLALAGLAALLRKRRA